MKVGDLVRLSSENVWRYPDRDWCKEQQLKIVRGYVMVPQLKINMAIVVTVLLKAHVTV